MCLCFFVLATTGVYQNQHHTCRCSLHWAEAFCLANASMGLNMSVRAPWMQFIVQCQRTFGFQDQALGTPGRYLAEILSWNACNTVSMQAAWEQAVVRDILGGMAAMRCFCQDLEQSQQQGLAHLHSLHQTEAQVLVFAAM